MAMAITAFKNNEVNRIILTRPAIEAGENLGFLPGDLQQKVDPYLRPLYDALYEIMGAENFARNMEKGAIEVAPLAYMRGRTLDNSFIVLDEAQNTTPEQMKMFLTRIGYGSKAVVTGDTTQIDLPRGKNSGLIESTKILKNIEDMLDIVHRLYENYDESYCKGKYLKSKSELLEMINSAMSDTDLKEELLCDTYSFNNCISVYRKVWEKKYSEKEIITKCSETIRIVNYYNSILISLKTFWQKCNCNIDEVNIHQQAISMRMYLFEVIPAIQIIQQDLQDYEDENLWNYNGFEDNYNLENMLYSYFFNEKALEYWKNIFSSDTCEKLSDQDIYKLLNWR